MSLNNNLLTLTSFSTDLESIDRNQVLTISLQGCREEVVPESFFSQFQNLEKVVLSMHVRWIRDNAFRGCLKLKTVRFERNKSRLKVIGNSAFFDCVELEKIHLTDNLSYIGNSAFYSCRTLETVTIPSSVSFIGISAFRDCESLRSVKFGSEIEISRLNESTFQNTGLETVTLPDSIVVIGPSCFSNCGKLEQVKLPPTVREIYNMAFAYCPKLMSAKYNSNEPIYISKDAFLGSQSIRPTVNAGKTNELLSSYKIVPVESEQMMTRWKTQHTTTLVVPPDVEERIGYEQPETDTESESEEEQVKITYEQQEQLDELDRLHDELTQAYEKGDVKRVEYIIKQMGENERRRDPDRQKIIKELNQSINFLQKQLLDVQTQMEASQVTIDADRTDSISMELRKIDKELNKYGISKEEKGELKRRKELLLVEEELIREYAMLINGIEDKLSAVYKMIDRLETDF
jgi:hypothetical protein